MVEIRIQVEVQIDVGDIAKVYPISTEIQGKEATIINIELKRPIAPEEVKLIKEAIAKAKKYISNELVIISGRGPIWMYCVLVHMFHGISANVAVLDPKQEGAVVVMSHDPYLKEGTVIKLPKELIEKVLQLSNPG